MYVYIYICIYIEFLPVSDTAARVVDVRPRGLDLSCRVKMSHGTHQ